MIHTFQVVQNGKQLFTISCYEDTREKALLLVEDTLYDTSPVYEISSVDDINHTKYLNDQMKKDRSI